MAEAKDSDHENVCVETTEGSGIPIVHEMQFADENTVPAMRVTSGQDMGGMVDMVLEHVRDSRHELVVGLSAQDEEDEMHHDVGLQLDVAEIRRGWKKLRVWQNLMAVLLVSGTVRYSKSGYNTFRSCFNHLLKKYEPKGILFPDYSTVYRTLSPLLREWGFVRSMECEAILDTTKSGCRQTLQSQQGVGPVLSRFKVILPSSWSLMDLECRETWNVLKAAAKESISPRSGALFSTIESVPMVRNRDVILDITSNVLPSAGDETAPSCPLLTAYRGDGGVVTLHLRKEPPFEDEVLRTLDMCSEGDPRCFKLTFRVVRTSLVVAWRERPPLTKSSRSELRYGTWKGFRRPTTGLWRAGDITTVLHISAELGYVMVLIQHHHRPTQGGQQIELVCIPFADEVGDDVADNHLRISFHTASKVSVLDVTVTGNHPSLPLQYSRPPIMPSYGKLKDGRKYFVDHILLYSDGFSPFRFKAGSAGGSIVSP